jgi:hypothetical protein
MLSALIRFAPLIVIIALLALPLRLYQSMIGDSAYYYSRMSNSA